jgi:glucose uptake protein
VLLPATYVSALLALIGAVLCFSLWPSFYKFAEARWRFELFAIDFGVGALMLAILAAYTFGTLGPEMSFNDRLLISGRSAELWVFATGAIAAFGLLLLLVSSSLLGMAAAFPISFGTAAILIGITHLRFLSFAWATAGIAILCVALIAAASAARSRRSGTRSRSWGKGVGLSLWAGIPFALVQWMLRHTADPEFGPGPYATALFFAWGMLFATPVYDFFFMHIKLVGNPIGYAHYKLGGWRCHIPGVCAGALWTLGFILLLAALNATGAAALPTSWVFGLALLAVSVAMLLAIVRWGEYRISRPWARILLILCAILFAAGSVALGLAYAE